MRVPLMRVIELLEYVHPEVRVENPDRWIKGVKLLPSSAEMCDPEYLYFCSESDLLGTDSQLLRCACVSEKHISPECENSILLHTNVPFQDVFNEICGFQNMLQKWQLEINQVIFQKGGLQKLVDISEGVFGNPILILDPALKTIACSTSFETDDPVFDDLLTMGYLTQENYNMLKENGYFTPDHYTGETLIIPTSKIKKYTSTLTALKEGEKVRWLVLMLFCNQPFSPGLFRLHEFFLTQVDAYFKLQDDDRDAREQFEYFLLDVLDGRSTDQDEIIERSKCFFPFSQGYNMIVVSLSQNTDMARKYALLTLRSILPNLHPTIFHEYIIMLAVLGEKGSPTFQNAGVIPRLADYLETADAYAGISGFFKNCMDLPQSLRQAKGALQTGMKIKSNGIEKDKSFQDRIFRFSEMQNYILLDAAFSAVPPDEACDRRLFRIREYDKKYKTDYFSILYSFLKNERNYTKTGKELNMHRNNVIYHIKRISGLFGIDFDDPETRTILLLSYKILELAPDVSCSFCRGCDTISSVADTYI